MTTTSQGYATADAELADLRTRLNAAIEASSIAESGRLKAEERIKTLEELVGRARSGLAFTYGAWVEVWMADARAALDGAPDSGREPV